MSSEAEPIGKSGSIDFNNAPEVVRVHPKGGADSADDSPTSSTAGMKGTNIDGYADGENAYSQSNDANQPTKQSLTFMQQWKNARRGWLTYIRTKEFWMVLAIGQILSLALTGQNTLTSLLAEPPHVVSIPGLQLMPNYFLLAVIYGGYTIYKRGFKGWFSMIYRDGWRYLILAFLDFEGNYFFVLAYRYTTILQAQLIDIWAIVVVVIISFTFLKVRYYWTQYLGILVALGGLGIMVASDHITGANSYGGNQHVKGDLFALLGATFYGFSNVLEEFLVSKRPLNEVLGQLGLYGFIIAGVQTAIFDRTQWREAMWTGQAGGYLTGFTLLLTLFYSLAPILFRLASAAFFNISLLTSDFWGLIVGTRVFGYTVHYLYPIAFVVVILGTLIYFLVESIVGEAKKPWLGENQELGVSGIGTAKRKAEKAGLNTATSEVEANSSIV